MESIIKVENFIKKYGDYIAVNDISFDVEKGSLFAFLGPNGAGKSTTINTLCTIFEKTSGDIFINGYDIEKEKFNVRKSIGIVFQESTIDNKMTVYENLKMHCTFYDVNVSEIDEKIDKVLNLIDLMPYKNKLVSTLSGGMKRRIEIARAIVHSPKILFLDEPTTGLDPQTRASIWDYVVKLQKEKNMTIFLTTHYLDEAEVCDKIAIMDHGEIIAYDTPHGLKKKYTKDKVILEVENEEKLVNYLTKKEIEFEKENELYIINFDEIKSTIELLSNQKDNIIDLEVKKGNLNDVFLNITGREMRDE